MDFTSYFKYFLSSMDDVDDLKNRNRTDPMLDKGKTTWSGEPSGAGIMGMRLIL